MNRLEHVVGRDLVAPHRPIDVLDRSTGETFQARLDQFVGERLARAGEQVLHDAPAELEILRTRRRARRPADRRPRPAGDHDAFPGRRRRRIGVGDDLDLVAVLQLGHQRPLDAVDARPRAVVADIGMHRIGKVDADRLARQGDQAALGREAIDLVGEQLELGVLEEFFRIGAVGERLHRIAQPGIGPALVLEARKLGAVLVERVRGDAIFRDLVHRAGADLHFDALAARADHGRVDRAVVIGLGRRNIVLEALRHGRPGGVDDTDRAVAVGKAVDDHTKADNVGQLLEGDRLALHLAVDRIGPLLAPRHLGADALVGKLAGELRLDLGDRLGIGLALAFEPGGQRGVSLRVDLAERQVLQLLAHVVHAHAAGKRGIDVERFLRDAVALGVRHIVERAHVVQPVGKLDQQDPHVGGDGEQQLAQVFRLHRLLGDEVELFQLGQAVDQLGDVLAEFLADILLRRRGILDRIVQERGHDGGIVQLEVGQDGRNFQRMREIGVAGGPLLAAMGQHGINIGAIQQGLVGLRIVALDAVHQLILPHHGRVSASARSPRRITAPG